MELNTKELSVVRTQVSKAASAAEELVIASDQDMQSATDILSKIKSVGRLITEKKEAITKPLNEALKNARALFAPIEADYAKAEATIKGKMLVFQQDKARRAAEAEAKILNDRRLTAETKAERLAEVEAPQTKVEGNSGAVQFKTVRKVVIENPEALPREYLVPDDVRIRKDALAGKDIPGVKVVEEQTVAAR